MKYFYILLLTLLLTKIYCQTKADSFPVKDSLVLHKTDTSINADTLKVKIVSQTSDPSMKDSDKIFWTFIFSLIGIGFGWFLNQAAQWFRARLDDKKNLKQVLFNQLELYFYCSRVDFGKIIDLISKKIMEKIPKEQQTDEVKNGIATALTNIVEPSLKPILFETLEEAEKNYQDSVKDLAKIDPIAAYYLSGRMHVVTKIETASNSAIDKLKAEFPNDFNDINAKTKQVFDILKPDILSETLDEIKKDARNIAWKINPIVWFDTLIVIRQIKKRADASLDKEIDDLLNKIGTIS